MYSTLVGRTVPIVFERLTDGVSSRRLDLKSDVRVHDVRWVVPLLSRAASSRKRRSQWETPAGYSDVYRTLARHTARPSARIEDTLRASNVMT